MGIREGKRCDRSLLVHVSLQSIRSAYLSICICGTRKISTKRGVVSSMLYFGRRFSLNSAVIVTEECSVSEGLARCKTVKLAMGTVHLVSRAFFSFAN